MSTQTLPVQSLDATGVEDLYLTIGEKQSAASKVAEGTAALGASMVLERGAGFLGNVLAARLAGAPVFGAYSLALGTANSISTYAAAGIGATAARFSGKYRFGSAHYGSLARALAIVSLVSSLLGALGMYLGAPWIASLLRKPSMVTLFHWAAWSVAGIVLVECARGFFVGQRRVRALLMLSSLLGTGMILGISFTAATGSATHMVMAQASVTLFAVALCFALRKSLALTSPLHEEGETLPVLREIATFGFVQMYGLVGTNVAGWWLTAVVARSDATLVQVSYLAVASQLRNIAGIVPGLLTEGSYSVMAEERGVECRTARRVLGACAFASVSSALFIALVGSLLMPWALRLVYGRGFVAAELTAVLGLAIAVVHMGNAPAAARLTIVSIRSTSAINTVWAVFVAAAATWLFFRGGSAASAMAVFFVGHLLSSAFVLLALARHKELPEGMALMLGFSTCAAGLAVVLSWLRAHRAISLWQSTSGLLLLLAASFLIMRWAALRYRWMPPAAQLRAISGQLARRVRSAFGTLEARLRS